MGKIGLALIGILLIAVALIRPGTKNNIQIPESKPVINYHPMETEKLREKEYPGSIITIEQNLEPGSNYSRHIASYLSDGNKIYGLLTLPKQSQEGQKFPIIVFIHGYIPPREYKTNERYVAYQDGLARSGFITYKIDLRGHDKSEGEPVNGHFSEAYVVDTINAISSMKKLETANEDKVGVWGHSNGGEIGLRAMTILDEIDAGVFWAGVVGSFEGMLQTYNSKIPFLNLERAVPELVKEKGLPSENPDFWGKIDPYNYLADIGGAIQLHHGTADSSVPKELSLELKEGLEDAGKIVEYYEYPGADHNLSNPAFNQAMKRSVEFFQKYLLN